MMNQDEPSASFDKLLHQGSTLLHQGRVNEAEEILEAAHRLNPGDHKAAMNLSSVYILRGRFRKAVPILDSLSERRPDDAMVWINLGAASLGNPILAGEEDQIAAIDAFSRAYSIDPLTPSAAYNIGLIYRDRQEYEEAIAWFKKAIAADPKDKDARSLLKRLRKKMDDNSATQQ